MVMLLKDDYHKAVGHIAFIDGEKLNISHGKVDSRVFSIQTNVVPGSIQSTLGYHYIA